MLIFWLFLSFLMKILARKRLENLEFFKFEFEPYRASEKVLRAEPSRAFLKKFERARAEPRLVNITRFLSFSRKLILMGNFNFWTLWFHGFFEKYEIRVARMVYVWMNLFQVRPQRQDYSFYRDLEAVARQVRHVGAAVAPIVRGAYDRVLEALVEHFPLRRQADVDQDRKLTSLFIPNTTLLSQSRTRTWMSTL